MTEFSIQITLTHNGKHYDEFSIATPTAADAIEEARHWLGNVIDNDDALTPKEQ